MTGDPARRGLRGLRTPRSASSTPSSEVPLRRLLQDQLVQRQVRYRSLQMCVLSPVTGWSAPPPARRSSTIRRAIAG